MVNNVRGEGLAYNGPTGSMGKGYTLIKAMTLDEALQLAKRCPTTNSSMTASVNELVYAME